MAGFSGDLFSVFQPGSSVSAASKRERAGSKRKGNEIEATGAKKISQISSVDAVVGLDAAEEAPVTAEVEVDDQDQRQDAFVYGSVVLTFFLRQLSNLVHCNVPCALESSV